MKIHPRVFIVQEAGNELATSLSALQKKHGLTYGEIFGMLGEEIAKWANYMVRQERHPDSDKRGGEA